jgi:hypothetical protein
MIEALNKLAGFKMDDCDEKLFILEVLEKELRKLNELNEELRKLQDRIDRAREELQGTYRHQGFER